jgi:hypothetical protein
MPPCTNPLFQRILKFILRKHIWIRAKEASDIPFIGRSLEPPFGNTNAFLECQDVERMGEVAKIDKGLVEWVVRSKFDSTTCMIDE